MMEELPRIAYYIVTYKQALKLRQGWSAYGLPFSIRLKYGRKKME